MSKVVKCKVRRHFIFDMSKFLCLCGKCRKYETKQRMEETKSKKKSDEKKIKTNLIFFGPFQKRRYTIILVLLAEFVFVFLWFFTKPTKKNKLRLLRPFHLVYILPSRKMSLVKEFLTLKGYQNHVNKVLRCFYTPQPDAMESQKKLRSFPKVLVHFVGDCQELKDSDFYKGEYGSLKDYCYENVGEKFAKRFPGTEVMIVKPTGFVNSRSIYSNFVKMTTEQM